MIDLDVARSDTPGCGHVVHLNNAGASLPPLPVVDAQIDYLTREAITGGYEMEAQRSEQIGSVYGSLARMLGCDASEIALQASATDAWNAAFASLDFAPGDRILTSEAEYASNVINFIKAAQRDGAVVEVVPSTPQGELDIDVLQSMIDERTKLIAISHVPTNGGLVNPAEEIGLVARAAGVTYLLDACQSIGQLDISVERLGCDLLTATGRKYLRGPRGTGFLFVRSDWRQEPHVLDLHSAEWTSSDGYRVRSDARRFETWEFGYAQVVGLGAAVDYALGWGMEAIEESIVALGATLREGLTEVDGVSVADLGVRRCGIVTFALDAHPAVDVVSRLRQQGINVSLSTPLSTPIDAQRRRLPDLIRASVHYFNSENELAQLIAAVGAIA